VKLKLSIIQGREGVVERREKFAHLWRGRKKGHRNRNSSPRIWYSYRIVSYLLLIKLGAVAAEFEATSLPRE